MEKFKSLKHLVIGGGSIGQRHLKNLRALGCVNLYCLRRGDDKTFAHKFNTKILTNEQSALELAPDIIYVCTPTSLHIDGFKLAVKCNSHLFMEKPLTHNRLTLDYMHRTWGNDRVFFIGYMLRYHPMVIKLKRMVADRVIGEIYTGRFEFGSYLPDWHPYEDYRKSYAARVDLGGGVINTVSHEVDLIWNIFGTPTALVTRKANYDLLRIDAEEIAESIFSYEKRMISLGLNYLQKKYNRCIKLLGDEGELYWDWANEEIRVRTYCGDEQTRSIKESFDINDLYVNEIKHFFTLVDNNEIHHNLDFNYAVKNTELLLQMHESAG